MKHINILIAIVLIPLLWSCGKEAPSLYLITGSYAAPESEGIKVFRFNENTGDAEYVSGLTGIPNPSYLTPTRDGNRIYAVGEEGNWRTSSANAISFDKEAGTLALLNSERTQGGSPCYISLDPTENFVMTANYMGGSITVFAVDSNGLLNHLSYRHILPGSGKDTVRQKQSHIHCVVTAPDNKYMLAANLGNDRVYIFNYSEHPVKGAAASLFQGRSEQPVADESGPRHICFHPSGKYAYLINEISGKVIVFDYDKGHLAAIQYIKADTTGAKGSGDIHISSDGRFLYASNRLQNDGIAIFSVADTGTLTKVGYQPTGIHPRNFIITPNGKFLLVACRDDNMIQVFRRDASTGLLSDMHKDIKTEKPVCLKFIGRE